MTEEELREVTVATGRWLYDGTAEECVCIIGLPYDYWYAIGEQDGQLHEDETPEPLGPEGLLYYAYFAGIAGRGYPTIIQAKGYAQSKVQSLIRWH
jgi:hypothetical protein